MTDTQDQNPKNPAGFNDLCDALLHLENTDECRSFLTDLCTPAEIKALSERWIIARMLDQGNASYRDISATTGASTTTVGRVARFLEKEPFHGYRLILERMKKGS